MIIKGLAHVCFTVRSLEVSLVFYRDTLGLPVAFDFVDKKGERFGIYLDLGGRNFLELFRGDPAISPAHPSFRHICLEVEDIRSVVNQLQARGLEVSQPAMGSDNSWQSWLNDPDGNRIELHQYTPASRQSAFLDKA